MFDILQEYLYGPSTEFPSTNPKFYDKYHQSSKILGAGILGGALGLIDGVSTWSLYKLSGETISERWARELQSIHNQNIAEDEKTRELR